MGEISILSELSHQGYCSCWCHTATAANATNLHPDVCCSGDYKPQNNAGFEKVCFLKGNSEHRVRSFHRKLIPKKKHLDTRRKKAGSWSCSACCKCWGILQLLQNLHCLPSMKAKCFVASDTTRQKPQKSVNGMRLRSQNVSTANASTIKETEEGNPQWRCEQWSF